MKIHMILIVLAVCLAITPCAFAQALSRASSWNPAPQTPSQTAMAEQVGQMDRAAIAAMSKGDYSVAEEYARKGLLLGWMGKAVFQEALASALNAEGKDQEALATYREIAATGSNQPRDLLPYALLLIENKQYEQAAVVYNRAISTYDSTDSACIRGEFSSNVAQPTELETACHIELGRLWTGQSVFFGGDPNCAKALDEYQKALQLSPDNALANLYKGDTLKRLGFKAQAQAAYAKAAQDGEGDVKKAAQDALNGR